MSNKVDSIETARVKVGILRAMVIGTMVLTAAAAFFVPGEVRDTLYSLHGVSDAGISGALIGYVYACAAPFLVALFAVKRLCDIISGGDSFSVRSLRQLSVIVWCCAAEIAVSAAAVLVFDRLRFQALTLNLFLIALSAVVAVFAAVLKELVKSAIRIREENELTI